MIIVPAVSILIVSAILFHSYIKIYEIPKGARDVDGKKAILTQSMIAEFSNRMQYSQTTHSLNELQSELQKQLLKEGLYSTITRDNVIVRPISPRKLRDLQPTWAVKISLCSGSGSTFSASVAGRVHPSGETLHWRLSSPKIRCSA